MSQNSSSQGEIVAAIGLLVKRRGSSSDAAEVATINEAIEQLNGNLQDLDQAQLLDAAKIVASAADTLERVVASARLGPFDSYLADIQRAIQGLQGQQGQMHELEKLAAAAPLALKPAGSGAGAPSDPSFAELEAEYTAQFEACQLRPGMAGNVAFYVERLLKFKPTYAKVGEPLHIPWYFIGILHAMEAGFNFSTHLHNGDPLTARTVHVPAGRPTTGQPPFTWVDSARDALIFEGMQHETQWTVARMLYLFERYNGMGYRARGLPSPYLWSFSTLYSKGKFVADGHFDAEAVSAQCGAGVMLKALQQQGVVMKN